jgi:hypothetical protein
MQMKPWVISFRPGAVSQHIRTREGLGFQTPKKHEHMQNLSPLNLPPDGAGKVVGYTSSVRKTGK